jgi:hypothetical protein
MFRNFLFISSCFAKIAIGDNIVVIESLDDLSSIPSTERRRSPCRTIKGRTRNSKKNVPESIPSIVYVKQSPLLPTGVEDNGNDSETRTRMYRIIRNCEDQSKISISNNQKVSQHNSYTRSLCGVNTKHDVSKFIGHANNEKTKTRFTASTATRTTAVNANIDRTTQNLHINTNSTTVLDLDESFDLICVKSNNISEAQPTVAAVRGRVNKIERCSSQHPQFNRTTTLALNDKKILKLVGSTSSDMTSSDSDYNIDNELLFEPRTQK